MAGHVENSLPIIDFAKIVDSSVEVSGQEKHRLFKAFVETGFVYLKNHSIPDDARNKLFAHAKEFFALPDEEKIKIKTGEDKAFHGWFSPQLTSGDTKHSDQKEAFDVGNDNDPTRPNQWPEQFPQFRIDMNFFFEQCHRVHLTLLQVLAQQVGIDEHFFEPYVDRKDHFFRVIYYPETVRESFKNRLRAKAHTDYGTITLLFNDNSGGLQVKHANGQYIDAPPIPGCAILNGKWIFFS
jgi:isopenicillin N synthase-like dioxygenase